MRILVIDGPSRGQVVESTSLRFLAVVGSPLALGENLRQVTYHVHKFYIGGRLIRLASTSVLSEDISEHDVFEFVVSDKAKEAAE